MHNQPEDKNLPSEEKLLSALAKELKNPLLLIARQAELEKTGDAAGALQSIQKTAENTLQLVDNYLLAARSEYGQHRLPLETVGVGSVIYEVANDIAPYAKAGKIDFGMEVKDGEVMANRKGLKAAIRCLSELVIAQQTKGKDGRQKVRIRAEREKEIISVSVLGSTLEITNKDIELARQLQGNAHLAGGKLFDSGVRLAIADILAGSLGASLQVRQIDGLKGLNFELARSTQLSLV